jgi:DNA-binding NarL/FixJ family response regulator
VNKPTRHRLTAIEREMVLSIARGCTDRDIAQQFLLSTDDVKRNLAKLFGKVGVDNRLELVIHAAGIGLLDQAARIR